MAKQARDPIPNPNVTRWAYHITKAALASGVPSDQVDDLAAAMLCMTHKESRGLYNLTSKAKTKAFGPMQQLPEFYQKLWDAASDGGKHSPDTHFRLAADVLEDNLKSAGGYLPSACMAYGSGGGGVAAWIEQGVPAPIIKGKDGKERTLAYVGTHLDYYDKMFRDLWGPYSAWYAGWVAAGKPLYVADVEVGPKKSDMAQVTLADHGAPEHKGSPMPNPYDGKHRWKGKERLYEPAVAGGGKDLDPSKVAEPGAESTTISLSDGGVAALGVAFGTLAAALLVAWKHRQLGKALKTVWKTWGRG
jgi:hypothetical protein